MRMAMRDYRFSNGTAVPKCTIIGVPSHAIQTDTRRDLTADTFDGFRFVGVAQSDGKHLRMTDTAPDYLSFGHGKVTNASIACALLTKCQHACPGRFWAANEIKMIVVYLLENFDLRLEGTSAILEDEWFCFGAKPNRAVRLQLRHRP